MGNETALREIAFPLNLEEQDRPYFEPHKHILEWAPKVAELEHVFVSHSGIVLKGFQVVPSSVYSYADRSWKYRKSALINFFLRPKNNIKTTGNTIVHNYYCPGYYHWVSEALLRAFVLRDKASSLCLYVPDYLGNVGYVATSLQALGFKKIICFPVKTGLAFDHLTLVEQPPSYSHYPSALLTEMGMFYREAATKQVGAIPFPKRLYVSRKKATRRKIANEAEVERLLHTYQFEAVCLEDLTFYENVALFANAESVVGIHGAAFTNLLFAKSGIKVLELIRRPLSQHHFLEGFWRFATVCGANYYYQFCESAHQTQSLDTDDLLVDLTVLARNLRQMELEKPD